MNGVDDHIKDMISDIQMFTSSISEYGTHTHTNGRYPSHHSRFDVMEEPIFEWMNHGKWLSKYSLELLICLLLYL